MKVKETLNLAFNGEVIYSISREDIKVELDSPGMLNGKAICRFVSLRYSQIELDFVDDIVMKLADIAHKDGLLMELFDCTEDDGYTMAFTERYMAECAYLIVKYLLKQKLKKNFIM